MGDIKNVIGYFCKYINCVLDSDTDDLAFRPEYIRLAKHNKTDNNIIYKFWVLLSKLEYPVRAHVNELSMIEKVKLNFALHKYKCPEFYSLPEDFSYSSRELLIALAWLISNTNILSKLVEHKISKYSINYEFPEQNFINDAEQKIELTSPEDTIRYISLLMGKINNNLRIINDCDTKTIQNMKKIHGATKYDLDIPHLSIHDLSISKIPDKQRQFLIDNQIPINLLEIQRKWNDCQGAFWKWMNTVLEEKINLKTSNAHTIEGVVLTNFIKVLKTEVHKSPFIKKQTQNDQSNINLPNFHSINIERHVYVPKKSSKETFKSTEQTDVLSHFLSDEKELNKNTEEISQSLSRISIQLSDKLKNVLLENDMKII